MDHLVPVAVPGATVEEVRRLLEALGLAGHVVDGHRLGFGGWVLARVGAEDGAALVLRGPDVPEDRLDAELLAVHLSQHWPGSQVGELSLEGLEPIPLLMVSPALAQTSVAVAPVGDLMLGLFASRFDAVAHTARRDDRLVVGLTSRSDGRESDEGGEDVPVLHDDVLVDALVNAKGTSVALWRRGPCTGLHVLRRGRQRLVHVWEPRWVPFGHPDLDGLRELLRPAEADAGEVVDLLDRSPDDVVALRALMRREEPDLDELVTLLGLPPDVVEVLEGRRGVADLPGAVEDERTTFRQAIAASEHDPAWMRAIERGSAELRPWYVVLSLLWLAMCVRWVVRWADGGSIVLGVVGLVGGLAQVVDLVVRWRSRRGSAT